MRMAGNVDKDYLNLFENRIKEVLENAINELSDTTDVETSVGKVNGLCINRVIKRPIMKLESSIDFMTYYRYQDS